MKKYTNHVGINVGVEPTAHRGCAAPPLGALIQEEF